MQEYPEIDVVKAAEEVKAYLDLKKLDLVDWGHTAMECYPDPKGPTTPELNRFASMWEEFFDFADKQQIDDDGNGFPHEIAKRYEALQKKVEEAVNGDDAYWSRIRAEVLPLYCPPEQVKEKYARMLAGYQDRWKAIELFYDPVGLDVTTTQIEPKRKLIRKTTLPPGFVIRVK